MSLLTISEGLAKNVGLTVPESVATSQRREWIEAVALSNAVGEELSRRVDWGQLQNSVTLTGSGENDEFDLGPNFDRLGMGMCMFTETGIARPLSRSEWGNLPTSTGTPRYFLLEGSKVHFWPYLPDAATVTANTQSSNWCSNGTASWMADDETSLIDEDLHLKGLIVRWRRQKGMDYADYEAEYEAAIQDFAGFNDRSRL